jgi:hypothetical protein
MAVMSARSVSDFRGAADEEIHTFESGATAEPWVCLRLPYGASHKQVLVSCGIHHVDLIWRDSYHWT